MAIATTSATLGLSSVAARAATSGLTDLQFNSGQRRRQILLSTEFAPQPSITPEQKLWHQVLLKLHEDITRVGVEDALTKLTPGHMQTLRFVASAAGLPADGLAKLIARGEESFQKCPRKGWKHGGRVKGQRAGEKAWQHPQRADMAG